MRLLFRQLATCTLLMYSTLGAMSQETATAPLRARQNVLTSAKNLTLTTTDGTTYYYLVSSEQNPRMYLGDSIRIGADTFHFSQIQSMRFRSLPRMILSEDSTTFDKTLTWDHALLALNRGLVVGKWNSVIFPFDLTGEQLLDAFGDEASLAGVRGLREANETIVEFQTMELHTSEVVLQANQHYLLRPSREADVESGRNLYNFTSGPIAGPIYLIPNVSMKASQNPRLQTIQNEDGTRKARFRGTYLKLDDSVVQGRIVRNKRIAAGMYLLDEEGNMRQTEDSTVVGAFRSWVEDLSSDDEQPIKFYIDGVNEYLTVVADGVEEIAAPLPPFDSRTREEGIFDLSGRRMPQGRLPKGIYIINGRKVAIK